MAEKEVVEVQEEPSTKKEKKPKKKHYWWRFLLCFLGGFLFAFVSVAGAGAIVGTVMKAKDVISMVGGNPDEVLGKDYQNSSILNLAIELSKKKFDTLEEINEISPLVKKTFDETINPMLKENLHFELDWETISKATFSEGDNNIGKVMEAQLFDGIKIVNFIKGASELKNIYNYFLYNVDEEGHLNMEDPISLGQYASGASFLNSIMDYISIGDVIDGADTSTDPIIIALRDVKISQLKDKMSTLTIGELFTDEQKAANPLLNDENLGQYTLNQLSQSSTVESIHINAILGNGQNLSKLMTAIYNLDLTIGELKTRDLTQDIKVGDIMDAGDSKIIQALSGYTIAQLGQESTILSLKLSDIIDTSGLDEDSLIYQYKDYTLSALKEVDVEGAIDLNTIKLFDIISPTDRANNALLQALYEKDPDMTVADLKEYDTIATIPLGSILGNVSDNVILSKLVEKGATIKNLSSVVKTLTVSDVITLSHEEAASHSIKANIVNALGSYPILEMADHFDTLTLGNVIYITNSSPLVLKSLQNVQLMNLSDALANLKVGEVLEIAPGSALDKEEIKNTILSNAASFETVLKANLSLDDVVDIDINSPQVLKSLASIKLDQIADFVPTLTLKDVLPLNEATSHPILWAMKDSILFGDDANINDTLENLRFNQVFEASDCQTGFMKLLWDDTDGGNFPLSQISSNTAAIVTGKTLFQLFDAGLITDVTHTDLEKEVIIDTQRVQIGTLTISKFLSTAIAYIPALPPAA